MKVPARKTAAILATGASALVAALALQAVASSGPPAPPPAPPTPPLEVADLRPRIDVVFVLDTTSSMTGLIEGAKQKIWSIANQVAAGQPRPDVRFGLVGFRDRGDAYLVRPVALTRDLDSVYEQLWQLRAEGGGDTPEDVNAAVEAALAMDWDHGANVARMIFLVGDAPPHDDYDGPKSWELASRARTRGITINAIRVGDSRETLSAWTAIASAAGGQVTSVDQSGGMMAVATPYDDELGRLNAALADTSIGYGAASDRRALEGKVAQRKRMKGEVAAAAASYSVKARSGLGKGDLLADLDSGRVALDTVAPATLPPELASMDAKDREAFVVRKQRERAEVEKRIAEVSARRDEHLRKTAPAEGDAFDAEVQEILEKQAGAIGVRFE